MLELDAALGRVVEQTPAPVQTVVCAFETPERQCSE
jgi:hypothetical protein